MILSFLSVSLGLILGRLSGFFREIFIATNLGATQQSDLVILLLTTPDFLVNLLVGGALSMALIPEFKSLGTEKSKALYVQVMMVVGLLFLFLTLLLSLNANYLISMLAPGIKDQIHLEYEKWFSLSLLSIPFTVLSGVTTAYLHYKNRFFVASLGTLIFNLVVIIFLQMAVYNGKALLLLVSIGILLASITRLVVFVFNADIFKVNIPIFRENHINVNLVSRYFHCIFSGGFFFIIPVALRSLSSNYGDSEISLINYATKLVEFPLGVLITVFSIIFFPKLSKSYSEKNLVLFSNTTTTVLLLVVFVSIASMFPLYFHSEYYIQVIFGHSDEFSRDDLGSIALYLSLYAISIPMQGANSLLIAALSAQRKTKLPLYASLISVIFFLIGASYFSYSVIDVLIWVVLSYSLCMVFLLYFAAKSRTIKFSRHFNRVLVVNMLFSIFSCLYYVYFDFDHLTVFADGFVFLLQSLLILYSLKGLFLKEK
ncbi:murein biosynthesis integral membrane protein MurJ [Vibrio amylolyticus]|uniref:murein biosynthesis integral membrane protein MurJ n=1 Tax=Vibrio amylolyticus TaxID=2847292 RepID=UPI00354F9785